MSKSIRSSPRAVVGRALVGAAALLVIAIGMLAAPANAGQRQDAVVIELYTSQGCSSCPPADAFMGELTKRPGVIGLTFHVNYWDYIGWKDTFATEDGTQRQESYGQVLGQRFVYTPQMVIGGRMHEVGSDREGVDKAIKYVAMHPPKVVPITARDHSGNIMVRLPETELEAKAWVWLVRFDSRHDVEIRRGENGGRRLSYFNVVRDINRIAVWTGQATDIPLDIEAMRADGRDGCAILVQAMGYGQILGAAMIEFAEADQ